MRQIMLILFVVVGAMFATTVRAQVCLPPPSGILGWWPGDGNANDIVDGNNGALVGGVTFGPGKVGEAFIFNGVDGFVNIPSPTTGPWNLGFTSTYTIEAWVKFDDLNTYRPLFFRGATNANDIEAYGQINTQNICVNHNRGNGVVPGTGKCFAPPPIGTLFHLAVTWDGATIRAYYNGIEQALGAGGQVTPFTSPLYTNKPWMIGKVDHQAFGGTFFHKGIADEVSFYNRALTSAEILAIFASGSAGKCKPGTVRAAYVANAGSNTVSVINPATNTVVATVPVGFNPVNIALTPNGARAYVTNAGSNTVSVIDTATNTVVATVLVGSNPVHAAATANGSSVYVANAGTNRVSVINAVSNTVVATVPVGTNPVHVAIIPDGTRAYVTNAGSNNVSVINTATNTVTATVPVGANPVTVTIF